MNELLTSLVNKQKNKCYYCGCEMNRIHSSPNQATTEHLIDKWSSPNNTKINDISNLVAACFSCNNGRGSIRNKIARSYYKQRAEERGIKVRVSAVSSRTLYDIFGAVPQNLFMEQHERAN